MRPEPFISSSVVQTIAWARRLSTRLKIGQTVGLKGDLGAGKTVLVRGICQGLKIKAAVTSPSFSLVNEYEGPVNIYHIDLYRLGDNADWEEIGLDYYLYGQGICLIEWPERLYDQAVDFDHFITIEYQDDDTRSIICRSKSS